jgi:hypothetical protein
VLFSFALLNEMLIGTQEDKWNIDSACLKSSHCVRFIQARHADVTWKSLHHAARACVQGIRDANGAEALSNASDLKSEIEVLGYSTVNSICVSVTGFSFHLVSN